MLQVSGPRRLSVALCTWQGQEFLEQQLASIAGQNRLPDEVVACDDASLDRTPGILRRFQATVPFPVRIFENATRLGFSRNFESAMSRCEGDIVVLADQDNVWSPDKLERLDVAFRDHPTAGLVFSDADVVDASLRPMGMTLYEHQGVDRRVRRGLERNGLPVLFRLLRRPLGLTLAFRSALLPLILPVAALRAPMPHDIWIDFVAASVSPVIGLDERLLVYRQHPAQVKGLWHTPDRPAPLAAQLRWREVSPASGWFVSYLLERLEGWTPPEGPAEAEWRQRAERSRWFLADRLRHIRAREGMPQELGPRVRTVTSELVGRRYHRHSRGAASAAKDLVRPRVPAQSG